MPTIRVKTNTSQLQGSIQLDGSKSISNRALMILKLAGVPAPLNLLENLSQSKDTQILLQLFENQSNTYDVGDAGTTFRWLTAYLATQSGEQILTGSARMQQRPIGALVGALRQLGASIDYLDREGFPPLKIGQAKNWGQQHQISIDAGVSSQFLSALLMIAPTLPKGLRVQPLGTMVSRPYLDLTIAMMQYFGIEVGWQGDVIEVKPGKYQPKKLKIEADWSAASYWFSMAAVAERAAIQLVGLQPNSWQGDAIVMKMMEKLGVGSHFVDEKLLLQKSGKPPAPVFEWNFLPCPDLAQTLAVTCAALGVKGIFSGLDTLAIKETDRVAALKSELAKVNTTFARLPKHFSKRKPDQTFYLLDGAATWDAEQPPRFETFGDHRMAMALAALAVRGAIEIENPTVVAKSYPHFWDDFEKIGGSITPHF